MQSFDSDRPIPFAVTDFDAPIPYRVRITPPSAELRSYVVPRQSVPFFTTPPVPEERPSDVQLKVA